MRRSYCIWCVPLLLFAALALTWTPTQAATSQIQTFLPLIMNPPAVSQQIQQLLDVTNQLRLANGCSALVLSPKLTAAAQGHSDDMAHHNYFSHIGFDGSTLALRINAAGYTGWLLAAENIAAGFPTAQAVVSAWFNEPPDATGHRGHRENILNCNLKEMGGGYTNLIGTTYTSYWTQDFGTRS